MFDNIDILIMAPVINLELLINGLLIGAVFALSAYGLALVWGVMNVKNLAQGVFVMAGGYACWWFWELGVHPILGLVLAAAVMWIIAGGFHVTRVPGWVMAKIGRAGIIGISLATGIAVVLIEHWAEISESGPSVDMFERFVEGVLLALAFFFVLCGGIFGLVIRKVLDRDLFTSLLATFGVAIVMEQMMNITFGSDTQVINLGYDSIRLFDGAISVGVQKVAAFVLACVLAVGVILFMKRSRMGQAIRATAQNPRAARVMGINTEKVYAFTFCLNGAICGAAGALIVMIWLIQPFYGIPYSIRAFVIVTAAGLGNLPGVIAVGFGMGVIEQFGGFILGAAYQQAIVVGLLLAVLAVRLFLQSRKRQVVE
jgi:branched-chain amino acid transport system permease protein